MGLPESLKRIRWPIWVAAGTVALVCLACWIYAAVVAVQVERLIPKISEATLVGEWHSNFADYVPKGDKPVGVEDITLRADGTYLQVCGDDMCRVDGMRWRLEGNIVHLEGAVPYILGVPTAESYLKGYRHYRVQTWEWRTLELDNEVILEAAVEYGEIVLKHVPTGGDPDNPHVVKFHKVEPAAATDTASR